MKVTVLVVDPQPLAYRYLATILHDAKVSYFGSVDGSTGCQAKRAAFPVILLADKSWTQKPLNNYIQDLRSSFPGAKILLLGNSLATEQICEALYIGVAGYLSYKTLRKKLAWAIKVIASNRTWASRGVLEEFVQYVRQRRDDNRSKSHQSLLTIREESVLALLLRKFSNKEIAYELKISERTVRFHLGNIFLKLDVHDRFSAMEAASRSGLPIRDRNGLDATAPMGASPPN